MQLCNTAALPFQVSRRATTLLLLLYSSLARTDAAVLILTVASPVFLLSELLDQTVSGCLRALSGPLRGRALLATSVQIVPGTRGVYSLSYMAVVL